MCMLRKKKNILSLCFTFIFGDEFYYVFLLNVLMAKVVEGNRTAIRSKLTLNQVFVRKLNKMGMFL